ncbi:PREDICTED: uncharacterized protein LOC109586910 [Amphimedon queenslandica]|nr:PREDICTED: uncharacterized protein LOC109586910 [Amphimedon queenslandica]|eukprot:XP_019858697.1 PREDICTED: uncharacterized protein LOC109586910 [Amphimedon queenslandica]
MNYTITVRAGNVLGGSDPSLTENTTLRAVTTGVPQFVSLLQPINNLTWNEVDCSRRNGLITGYTVRISNNSITYNLTSTERHIILNDLVFGTVYNISVAATNSVGKGPFSDSIVVEIGIVSSPVESVSSIMDTTWAVISWSVPSYIPSDHPIITYEIGYHMFQSGNCSIVDDVDVYYINTLALNQNVSCGSTFTIITGLYSDTCYIFGLRPYTDNGYGAWTFITSETLTLQSPTMSIHIPSSPTPCTCISTSTSSGGVIAVGVLGGIWLILLTVIVIVHVYYFLRMQGLLTAQAKTDEDIAMQVCTPYDLHKTEVPSKENERAYEECEAPPDAATDDSIYDL